MSLLGNVLNDPTSTKLGALLEHQSNQDNNQELQAFEVNSPLLSYHHYY